MDSALTPPLILSAIALFAVVYVVIQVLQDLRFYSRGSGFLSTNTFFMGTFISFFALGVYVAIARYETCGKSPSTYILASSLFYLFYWLFSLNLTLRAEFYNAGARLPITTGAFYLFMALLVILFIFAYDRCTSAAWLLLIVVGWTMLLMWNWVYKT